MPRPAAGLSLPREPKQERSRRKQAVLIDAAERLFAARGFDAVTVDEIAAEAGFASATFYNYFADKTQIFILVADRHVPAIVPMLSPVLEAFTYGGSIREAIRSGAAKLIDARSRVPWLRKDWRALALTEPQVHAYQETLDRLWDRDVTAVLRAGVEAGRLSVDDPETMAQVVRVAVDSVVDDLVIQETMEIDAALDALTQLIASGLVERDAS